MLLTVGAMQTACCTSNILLFFLFSSDFMLDECSVARNSLLVAMYFMGGAEECARPPYYIHEVSMRQ